MSLTSFEIGFAIVLGLYILFHAGSCEAQRGITPNQDIRSAGWRTDLSKRSIDLSEIISGGPPKGGIPAIDRPAFVSVSEARSWLGEKEPVIAVEIEGQPRAYPLQILIWHEIVNDDLNGTPIAVTFCPLCYSAVIFDRRLDGQTLSFGVSGLLRHSDMVMYDRQTESWWQQITGEAIVGDFVGRKLKRIPAQIVGFKQFAEAHPLGNVLSRDTGHKRQYGNNPYSGYDDIDGTPLLYRGAGDSRLRPMEKVVAVELDGKAKAYPHSITRKQRVVHDRIGQIELVVFHSEGVTSALDAAQLNRSREAGATGVFDSRVDGKSLHFRYENGAFIDTETSSHWNVLGQAYSGKLKGKQLLRLPHGDYFAFAWLAFRTNAEIFRESK